MSTTISRKDVSLVYPKHTQTQQTFLLSKPVVLLQSDLQLQLLQSLTKNRIFEKTTSTFLDPLFLRQFMISFGLGYLANVYLSERSHSDEHC